jgi:excisionase family DNA binding protein
MKTTAVKSLKRLYRLPEAAVYLGRSTWSVRRLIWSGELPSVRAAGRVHVDVQDMDEFIEKHKFLAEDCRLTIPAS